ncbi:hypothetical protein FO059_12610 [Tomitella fengzijianii]|uniref:Uncharacterized protein n=1 Tax=Tomitella fengzijianii TaxID=2597660 RepID=A0A516X8C6_9ACTN|nr:hypothetical protein FO059_12610 [Tomitella fengzijianii]
MPNNVVSGDTPITVNVIFQLFSAGSSTALAQSGLGSTDLGLGSSGLGSSGLIDSLSGLS